MILWRSSLKTKYDVSTTMTTDLLSEVLTDHKKKIGALHPDSKFTVVSIEGDKDFTKAHGFIEKENHNV